MNRTTIGLIWLGGLGLMLLLYAIGPQHFLAACQAFFVHLWLGLDRLMAVLAYKALDAVRAAAIALYVVFVALAVLARRHGMRSGGTLMMVSVLFLILVQTDWYDPGTKWLAAAVVAGVGAAMMTGRLLRPPPPPPGEPGSPWGHRPFSHDGIG